MPHGRQFLAAPEAKLQVHNFHASIMILSRTQAGCHHASKLTAQAAEVGCHLLERLCGQGSIQPPLQVQWQR